MKAVRDDTIAASAIGIDVLRTRLVAFVVGAFFAGVGGSLYAHYLGSFSPITFYFAMTMNLIAMLVLGGMGSLSGALVGVVCVSILSELLRSVRTRFQPVGRCGAAAVRRQPDRTWHSVHPDHDLPAEGDHGRQRTHVRSRQGISASATRREG